MTGWTAGDQGRLLEALNTFDRPTVVRLADAFGRHVAQRGAADQIRNARQILKGLHRKRHIDLVHRLAETLLCNGLDDQWIRYHYVLAMLDEGRTVAAEAMLLTFDDKVRDTNAEVQGALGRLHKQRYLSDGVGGGRPADLAAGVDVYRRAFRKNPKDRHYQGINAAALLWRADHDGVKLPGYDDVRTEAREIASAILARIEAKPTDAVDMWEFATAAEACLILDRPDAAIRWLSRYVGESDADAFEIGSTLRQFTEVFGLTADTEPGQSLIPLLQSRLLRSEGGRIVVDGAEAGLSRLRKLDELEKRFSDQPFRSIGWLKDALICCRSVARIETRHGDGVGTGFLLDGGRIAAGLPTSILLTNAHVVPDELDPAECYANFRGTGAEEQAQFRYRVGSVLWTSPAGELDATVLRLADHPGDAIAPLRIYRGGRPARPNWRPPRAYVIGYPNGVQDVCLSLHDTLVLDTDDTFVHYRSPTEGGSSGSPVFDARWNVIALHHRGSDTMLRLHGEPGTYEANEGIRMDRLVSALADEFGPPTYPGR